jgi:putative effector of murein hydrolase
MTDFVQLWTYLSSIPLFGLMATVLAYVLTHAFYGYTKQAPWASPVAMSVLVLGSILLITNTPYQVYFSGAQFVHVLLGPAVVALAWPLWERRSQLRERAVPLVVGSVLGSAVTVGSAIGLGRLLHLPTPVLMSLAPKSVTAPVAMGIAERLSGIPALAAIFAVITGVVGALSGKYIFNALGVHDWSIRGFALGTMAQGIGAARAMSVHPDAGAYAAVGLGLQVLLGSFLIPLVVTLMSW